MLLAASAEGFLNVTSNQAGLLALLLLQRYVQTGIPHIANKKRSMVALHKVRGNMHSLSCCGEDTIECVLNKT
jgi:hypothetical protein